MPSLAGMPAQPPSGDLSAAVPVRPATVPARA
jgi:hypothetical protein